MSKKNKNLQQDEDKRPLCKECAGAGIKIEKSCPHCDGSGREGELELVAPVEPQE